MCVIGSFIMRPTSFMLYILVCITDDIQPWLIKSEKWGPGPCDLDLQWTQQIPGSAFFEFPFKLIDQSNYSNPATQLGAQNKDFGPGSQTDLTRGL